MNTEPIAGNYAATPCAICRAETVWRKGKFGYFKGCTRYPGCRGKGKGSWRAGSEDAEIVEGAPTPERVVQAIEEAASAAAHESDPFEYDPPKEHPPVSTSAATHNDPLSDVLWHSMESRVQNAVKTSVQEALKDHKSGPSKIEWTLNGLPFAEVDGTHHAALEEVLKRVKAGLKNILLVGPAGSGKTKLASDVAKALGLPFSAVSCTAGMPEWHIIGRSTPNLTDGTTRYQPSQWSTLYENGGVGLLDEIDAADPNVLLVMNSALSNGHLSLPARAEKPEAKRAENFVFLAAANTWGTAATRQYVGRNQLDASTLSRFACSTIEVDYDKVLEEALVDNTAVRKKVWAIRQKVADTGIRRVVGTRELLNVAALVRSGETLDWALKALTVGWTPDELTKVGVSKE